MTQPVSLDPGVDLGPILDPTHRAGARYASGWRPPVWPGTFFSLVDDGQETTLVCAESEMQRLSEAAGAPTPSTLEHGWRRITFAGPLPWEQVGFLADVAGRLAAVRIPLAAMSGFTTDHLLVRAAHADLAVEALRGRPPEAPAVVGP